MNANLADMNSQLCKELQGLVGEREELKKQLEKAHRKIDRQQKQIKRFRTQLEAQKREPVEMAYRTVRLDDREEQPEDPFATAFSLDAFIRYAKETGDEELASVILRMLNDMAIQRGVANDEFRKKTADLKSTIAQWKSVQMAATYVAGDMVQRKETNVEYNSGPIIDNLSGGTVRLIPRQTEDQEKE